MPEGVEVCLTALFLKHEFEGKELTEFKVIGGRYSRHKLDGIELLNNKFVIEEINSKGKLLWFKLVGNETLYLFNKFGLEGMWSFVRNKHSGVMMKIGDDVIYYNDSRNFGSFLVSKVYDENLAPDFLKNEFADDWILGTRLEKRKIVEVLMDQRGLGSGLGNYLVAEILYHVGISPYTLLVDISKDAQLSSKLLQSIKYITKLAFLRSNVGYIARFDDRIKKYIAKLRKEIENDSNHEYNFHKDVVLGDDVFQFNVYRRKYDLLGNKVKADKIIQNRTTYWVPDVQVI